MTGGASSHEDGSIPILEQGDEVVIAKERGVNTDRRAFFYHEMMYKIEQLRVASPQL